jgi:hypothetical protein
MQPPRLGLKELRNRTDFREGNTDRCTSVSKLLRQKDTHKATDKLPVKRSGRQGKDAGGDGERGHEVADPTVDLTEGWRRGRNRRNNKSINQQCHHTVT